MADGGIAGLRIDITALKQAQEALRERQVMLNRAQQLSCTGSVVRNLKTKATEWSDEMCRIMGIAQGGYEPRTEKFLALVHPDDRQRVADAIENGLKAVSEPPMEFRIIRPDGTVRWVYREADFWCDPDGTPAGRLATYKDITEEREAASRRRDLEVLLRDAIESISEGFVIYDAEDRLVLCNDAYRSFYPRSKELLVPGTRFEDILRIAASDGLYVDAQGREREWLDNRIHHHRALGGTVEVELSDGRWMLVSERRTSSGGTAGLRIDITALKRVQQSLHESQQRLDRTQQIAHIGTVERNLLSNDVIWSNEMYRIFGVTREECAPSAETLIAFVHPEDRSLVATTLRRGDLDHANSSIKFRIVRPNGEIRTVFSQADVARDKTGRPQYISIAMMDITESELANRRHIELESSGLRTA